MALERLTPREAETMDLACEGLTAKEIADRMNITKRTVDFFLAAIYRKWNVSNRTAAAVHHMKEKGQ